MTLEIKNEHLVELILNIIRVIFITFREHPQLNQTTTSSKGRQKLTNDSPLNPWLAFLREEKTF